MKAIREQPRPSSQEARTAQPPLFCGSARPESLLGATGATRPSIFSKELSLSAPKVCRLAASAGATRFTSQRGRKRHGSSMIASARSPFAGALSRLRSSISRASREAQSAGCDRAAPLRRLGLFSPALVFPRPRPSDRCHNFVGAMLARRMGQFGARRARLSPRSPGGVFGSGSPLSTRSRPPEIFRRSVRMPGRGSDQAKASMIAHWPAFICRRRMFSLTMCER
jgi:hypothetical protein